MVKKRIVALIILFSMAHQLPTMSSARRFLNLSELMSSLQSFVSDVKIGLIKTAIKSQYPVTIPTQPVVVQEGVGLCAQEQTFIERRMQTIQITLQQEFGIVAPLRMAFCCSGGGNRAMIGTLGILLGAAKCKMLDATLYLAGLSGSTWLLSAFSYLQTNRYADNVTTLLALQEHFARSLSDTNVTDFHGAYIPGVLSLDGQEDFISDMVQRYGYDQRLTLIDLFGPFVSKYSLELLGDQQFSATWSSLQGALEQGLTPLPLCSAAFQYNDTGYGWFEMSPFQAGSSSFGYIPVQYLGSKFDDGVLDVGGICPEYPISFYLGVYGSGFAATLHEAYNYFEDKSFFKDKSFYGFLFSYTNLKTMLNQFIQDILNDRDPLTYAQFPYFGKNNVYPSSTAEATAPAVLGLFDAGIDMNIPLPTFIDRPDRAVDLVIVYDSNPGDALSMQKIYAYGVKYGVDIDPSLATITAANLNANVMTVFNDPRTATYNVAAPTLLYFPTQNVDVDTFPYSTFNFFYTPDDVYALVAKMEQAFTASVAEITQVMQAIAALRYG